MEDQASRKTPLIILLAISLITFIILYHIPIETLSPMPPALIQFIRVFFLFAALYIICERLFIIQIYNKIFLGLVLGAVAGIVFQTGMVEIRPIGTAFIRLIRMVIIPLVFASLLIGTASMDPKKMGRIGLKTLTYYLVYTAFAIFIGLVLANLLKPGACPESSSGQALKFLIRNPGWCYMFRDSCDRLRIIQV